MLPRRLTRFLAVAAVAVSLASGGLAVANPSAGNAAPQTGRVQQSLRAGMGEIIRGEAADKAIAEAIDARSKGRVNQGHGNHVAKADSPTR
jgi:hypothetical protein